MLTKYRIPLFPCEDGGIGMEVIYDMAWHDGHACVGDDVRVATLQLYDCSCQAKRCNVTDTNESMSFLTNFATSI